MEHKYKILRKVTKETNEDLKNQWLVYKIVKDKKYYIFLNLIWNL